MKYRTGRQSDGKRSEPDGGVSTALTVIIDGSGAGVHSRMNKRSQRFSDKAAHRMKQQFRCGFRTGVMRTTKTIFLQ